MLFPKLPAVPAGHHQGLDVLNRMLLAGFDLLSAKLQRRAAGALESGTSLCCLLLAGCVMLLIVGYD